MMAVILAAADIVRESTGNTASYWQEWPHSSTKSADTNPTFEINAMQSYKTVATLRVKCSIKDLHT